MTKAEQKKIRENRLMTVAKANEIITKSRFSLNVQEQKILGYLISKIKPEDDELTTYEFSIIDFCNTCGINYMSGNNYYEIKRSIQSLRDKSLWVKMEDGSESLVSWIEKARIKPNSGIIEIKLDNDLKPYLLHLQSRGNYTSYSLIYTLHMKSKYSIRLYELIKAIRFNKKRTLVKTFTIEEIQQHLGAEKYNCGDFKRRVLEPAIAEVNQFTDNTVYYELLTKPHSRKVEGVKLIINTKDMVEALEIQTVIDNDLDKGLLQETLFDDTIDLLE